MSADELHMGGGGEDWASGNTAPALAPVVPLAAADEGVERCSPGL